MIKNSVFLRRCCTLMLGNRTVEYPDVSALISCHDAASVCGPLGTNQSGYLVQDGDAVSFYFIVSVCYWPGQFHVLN